MRSSLNITFVLPVIGEQVSLRKTVETILEVAPGDVFEILIVVADRTLPGSLTVAQQVAEKHPDIVRIHKQRLPFLGGAMQEAFELARGDHVMLMSSDLETDPALIPVFIQKMREGCWDIVVGSRWAEGGGFQNYDRLKFALNYVFQRIFRALYLTKLTDLTYAYRLYRREALRGYKWTELKHPFLLECLVKPLRCGARVAQIPCFWRARTEGESVNSLLETFRYLPIAVKTRFPAAHKIRRGSP